MDQRFGNDKHFSHIMERAGWFGRPVYQESQRGPKNFKRRVC
jgi:hypothetical protein